MPSVLNADALTTLNNLKDAVNISTTDTSKDNHLERCINRATWWIESETGRKLKGRKYNGASGTHATTSVASEDYIYFDGTPKNGGGDTVISQRGLGEFYLPAWPVRANSETGSVTFALDVLSDRDADDSPTETWDTDDYMEFDDFIVDRENGILRLLGGPFTPGTRNYRITMAAGYVYGSAQPYVPPDLEELCIMLATQLYRGGTNMQSESIGTWSRTFATQKEDPFVSRILAKYTRIIL